MYARHVTYHAEPGNRERVVTLIESLMPEVRRQRGFVDMLMLVDEVSDEYIGVSTWHSREDAEAITTTILPMVMTDLAAILDEPPRVRIFEVHQSRL